MAEPTTSIAASGAAIKFGIVTGVGALLSAVVVMAMTLPATKKEWAAGLISTVAGSVLGGAFVIQKYQLAHWIDQGLFGTAAVAGVMFAAGLPMWVIVRAFFRYAEKSKSKTLLEMYSEWRAVSRNKSDNA